MAQTCSLDTPRYVDGNLGRKEKHVFPFVRVLIFFLLETDGK